MESKEQFYPLGDCAIAVKLGHEIDMHTHQKVIQFSTSLSQNPFKGMIEIVPAYLTVTVYYAPHQLNRGDHSPYSFVCNILRNHLKKTASSQVYPTKMVEIPVCYGGDLGPDLPFVAKHNGMDPDRVVHLHAAGEYLVYMIGFMPGFPYLGGLSKHINTPRKVIPRQSIAMGSIGIAGNQTGIYPLESPGGWQIIGRTPLTLFQATLDPPSLLHSGDIVRFYPISREAFDAWEVESL